MPTLTTQKLWDNHPYPGDPCDKATFTNQCAIRMGVALAGAGLSLGTFRGAKCWLRHTPRHILRAQELANWLVGQTTAVGTVTKYKTKVSNVDFAGKKGIVFIKDGWGATDHIDVWDGTNMKAGSTGYFALGKEVWFWELP
jgi:hypothetical protein